MCVPSVTSIASVYSAVTVCVPPVTSIASVYSAVTVCVPPVTSIVSVYSAVTVYTICDLCCVSSLSCDCVLPSLTYHLSLSSGGDSSVGRTSDFRARCNTDMGSSPRWGRDFSP